MRIRVEGKDNQVDKNAPTNTTELDVGEVCWNRIKKSKGGGEERRI